MRDYTGELQEFYRENIGRYYQHRTKLGQEFVLIQHEGCFKNEEFFKSKLAAKVTVGIDKLKTLFKGAPIYAHLIKELPTQP